MITTLIGLAILFPTDANPDTTPLTCINTATQTVCLPEEDPSGGYPTSPTMWLDNSPLYSGGWLLKIDDQTHTVEWVDVHDRLTIAES